MNIASFLNNVSFSIANLKKSKIKGSIGSGINFRGALLKGAVG
jgi:uncharacterized protein YjbI with pentapeptide repeats